jgi:hypothetical protein
MPQGRQTLAALLNKPPDTYDSVQLDQRPYRETNPKMATLEDFLLGAIGLRDGLSPTASKASTAGLAAGFLGPAALGAAMRTLRGAHAAIEESTQVGRRLLQGSKSADKAEVWFHGSPVDIYNTPEKGFKPATGESGVPVVWGTKDWTTAEDYARGEVNLSVPPDATGKHPLSKSHYPDRSDGGVYRLKSEAKNPLEYDAAGKQWFQVPQGKILRDAKLAGHDAVVFRNIRDGYVGSVPPSDVIAWLDPQAIKPDAVRRK